MLDSWKLLILACSKRKRSDSDLLPAIQRYDGPTFRLLRRYLQEQPSTHLDIYILSAEFGLIAQKELIPNYDRKMTPQRSRELQPEVSEQLKCIFHSRLYQEVWICVGKDYFQALNGYDKLINYDSKFQIATGSIGKKLVTLYHWLYGQPPKLLQSKSAVASQGKASLKGIEVVMTPEQVLDVARSRLAEGKGNPASYQSWYVLVDDQQISPKWLVSQLTGLPVSAFHSSTARRILQQLGIQIYVE